MRKTTFVLDRARRLCWKKHRRLVFDPTGDEVTVRDWPGSRIDTRAVV
jgi:hypothetical protein